MLLAQFNDKVSLDWLTEKGGHFNIGDLSIQKHLPLNKVKKMIDKRFSKATSRRGLMEKYGFGSHLVRLMLESKELLETGELMFPLKEQQLILDIKLGKYKMEEVLEMADYYEAEIETWTDKSDLPAKPRYKEIQELCMYLVKFHLGYK